jgi:hypothetical protein
LVGRNGREFPPDFRGTMAHEVDELPSARAEKVRGPFPLGDSRDHDLLVRPNRPASA